MSAVAFRRFVAFYHLILAGAGVAIAILSLTLLVTAPIIAIAPQSILIGGLVIGLLLVFVTLLGAAGASNDKGSPALALYMVVMLAIIGASIWGVSTIGISLHDERIKTSLDRVWNLADNSTVVQIESWGQCCGFFNYTDRIQQPCTQFAEEVGCYEPMRSQYEARLTAMMVPSTIIVMAEGVGLILAGMVLYLVWNEGRQAKLIGDRQPFDAWHKAVFQ